MTPTYIIPVFLVSFSLLFLSSCNQAENVDDYQLPENVVLTNGAFFDPLHADGLLGNPNRTESIWSDSLLKLCEIKKITISCLDLKNPEKINTEIIYEIDKHGNLSKFKYYEYNKSDKSLSKSIFYNSKYHKLDSIKVLKFYGINSSNSLHVKREKNNIHYTYDKGPNKFDHITYYYKKKKLEMIVKKVGDVITHIDFIIPEGRPISTLKNMSLTIHDSKQAIDLAEKNVIYLVNNLPSSCYLINSDWAELGLMKEWKYDKSKNLVEFKEWVNRSLIQEMSFNYSRDNVLRSIKSNKETYRIAYN